jgi:mediator of RNA polymerase II transcription subunit 13, fungi type
VDLLAQLPVAPHIVLYCIAPPNFNGVKSKAYQQLAALFTKEPIDERVLLHFVPYHTVFDLPQFAEFRHGGLETIANSVYNRLLRPVERVIHRGELPNVSPIQTWVQAPAFTVSRPLAPSFKYVLDWPVQAIVVMDRHSLLHVGYRLSTSREWLLASCIDQRGEAYELQVWMLSQIEGGEDMSMELKIACQLFRFATNFARRAKVEWKVVISKMGRMTISEVEGMLEVWL